MSKQERNEGKAGISDLTVIALVTSVLMPPVGWVAGFKARKQIEDSENKFTGRPFAVAAIWIGGILTTSFILMAVLMALVNTSLNNDDGRFGRGGYAHMGNHRMFDNNGDSNQGENGIKSFNGLNGGPGMMFQPDPSQPTKP